MNRQRRKYVKAMLKAINKAREPVWNFDKPVSKTYGLRVIRRFEKVNRTRFDPFDSLHVEMCTGHGNHEQFFRRIKAQITTCKNYSNG